MKLTPEELEKLTNIVNTFKERINECNKFLNCDTNKLKHYLERLDSMNFSNTNENAYKHFTLLREKAIDFNGSLNELEKIKDILLDCNKNDVSLQYLNLVKSQVNQLNNALARDGTLLKRVNEKFESTIFENEVVFLQDVAHLIYSLDVHVIPKAIENASIIYVFNKIKEIENNIVLIGANGSGKSRFSRKILQIQKTDSKTNVVCIPAQHYLGFSAINGITNDDYVSLIRNYENDLKVTADIDSGYYVSDFRNLMCMLLSDYADNAFRQTLDNAKFCKVKKCFEKLIPSRRIVFDLESKMFKAMSPSNTTYDLNDMSDGEKTILYFIVHVLFAQTDSYIVIDEPENHLHFDACVTLWNELENERQDCRFIYLSHNIDFVVSRKNSTLIWNKKFDFPNNWDIEVLSENELPKNVYLSILGTVPPILFCEGDSNSIDYFLYSALFPNYLIKPSGGCGEVLKYFSTIKKLKLEKNKDVFAIIDRDNKTQEDVNRLKNQGVYVLKLVEAENILFTDEIINAVFTSVGKNELIDIFKNDIFDEATKQLDYIVNRRLKSYIKDRIDKVDSRTFINSFNEPEHTINEEYANELYKTIQKEAETIIQRRDYSEALVLLDLKGLFFDISNKYVKNYKDIAVDIIKNSSELQEIVKQKYIIG